MLRSTETPYLVSCLAENLFCSVRIGAIKTCTKAYLAQHMGLPLTYLTNVLAMDSDADCAAFLETLGVEITTAPHSDDRVATGEDIAPGLVHALRATLEEAVYNFEDEIQSNALDAHVSRLRRKLADTDAGVEIHSIRGVGYLLKQEIGRASCRERV